MSTSNIGTYSVDDWIKHMSSQFITINDIKKLQQNDKIKFLCLDRNVYDLCDWNSKGDIKNPELFFGNNYTFEYTHYENLKGSAKWNFQNDDENPVPFEFEIEYKQDHWYPLTDGNLPEKDCQGFFKFPKNMKKDWKEYPPNTCIGWRGPMLLWNTVKNGPQIYR